MLLADWGMTARDIRRQVAAAKARALANDNKRMAAEIEGQRRATDTHGGSARAVNVSTPPAALGHASGAPGGGIARASVIDGVPSVTFSVAGGNDETAPPPPAFQNFISRLGGAVPRIDREAPRSIVALAASKSANVAVTEAGKSRFLRAAHVSACKIFGTVLGPEANNAHRNHFHIDLAQRRSGAFCQ
ncbi:MAG: extensin family protein [Hyphomicrobiaceae bacterium]|nr:extensin family protein [Hyphomicrobiaceae bacterium]